MLFMLLLLHAFDHTLKYKIITDSNIIEHNSFDSLIKTKDVNDHLDVSSFVQESLTWGKFIFSRVYKHRNFEKGALSLKIGAEKYDYGLCYKKASRLRKGADKNHISIPTLHLKI